MMFRHIEVAQATPTIGAYVSGVDLNNVSNAAVYEEIRQALHTYKVIFFRDQPLTPEAHLKLGATFGEMEQHEFFPHLDNHSEIQIISSKGTKAPDTDRWHTDVTFREKPNLVTVLRAVDLPPLGGDTMWACMNAAFETLDGPMKKMLLELDAEHDVAHAFRTLGHTAEARRLDAEDQNPPYIHPAVINHPVTGKLTLFVNSVWTKRFIDIHDRYGENLLRLLAEWVKRPEFQVRFRWEKDSVAIWDNLATQHYAVFDYPGQSRRMNRVTCAPTPVRLDARPHASRLAPITAYGEESVPMMSAMRPALNDPLSQSAGMKGSASAMGVLDESRLNGLSDSERRAARAVFDAIQSLDLEEIVRRSAQV